MIDKFDTLYNRAKRMLRQGQQWTKEDLWSLKEDSFNHLWLYNLVCAARVVVVAFRKFKDDECADKASALTYYTVLSIVPVIAMAFGIAQAFGFVDVLRDFIERTFVGQEMVADYLLEFADKYIVSMKGGLIAGISFGLLLWSIMGLIGHAESTFNRIWEIKKSRSLVRKFSDYISLTLVAIIVVAAFSSFMLNLASHLGHDELFSHFVKVLLVVIPLVVIWIALSLLYYVLPNTKVNYAAALIGGIIAGTALVVQQYLYVEFQVGISSNNVVYGSFAAIPLFLIWVQTTWYIIMWGCEASYASQNVKSYLFNADTSHYSLHLRRNISLYMTYYIVKAFEERASAPTARFIARKLELPPQIVNSLLVILCNCGIISEIQNKMEDKVEAAYQPAFDINKLTVKTFVDLIEEEGDIEYPTQSETYKQLSLQLAKVIVPPNLSESNMLIKDMLDNKN